MCGYAQVRAARRFDGSGWHVWECEACEESFVWPIPPVERLAEWYRFDVYARRTYARTCRHNVQRIQELRALLQAAAEAGAPVGRLLDVGCSVGHMLEAARAAGWTPEGIEIDAATAHEAEARAGVPVHVAVGLESLQKDDRFGLIVMSHWLEHTPEPGTQLDLATRHLVPGGMILLRVPNAEGTVARLLRDRWTWYCPPIHLHYLTRASIETAARQRRLRVVWMREQQGDAQPLAVELLAGSVKAVRSWRRRRERNRTADEGTAGPPPKTDATLEEVVAKLSDIIPRVNPLRRFEDSEILALLASGGADQARPDPPVVPS